MKTLKQILITAVVAALVSGVGVPYAKQHLINGKQIKKGTITGKQVKFPSARGLSGGVRTAAAAPRTAVGADFQPVAVLGSYNKADANSVLRIDWTGGVSQTINTCVFQVRVDGVPGEGGLYTTNAPSNWVNVSALFNDIGAGDHLVEVYAKALHFGGADTECSVDPDPAQPASQSTATEEVR
jgi:hypothetical protein